LLLQITVVAVVVVIVMASLDSVLLLALHC
jgi:hypothetical protein